MVSALSKMAALGITHTRRAEGGCGEDAREGPQRDGRERNSPMPQRLSALGERLRAAVWRGLQSSSRTAAPGAFARTADVHRCPGKAPRRVEAERKVSTTVTFARFALTGYRVPDF